MATVKENVDVPQTGDLSYAPLGTALPTSTSAALAAAFLSVGYLGPDGVTFSQPSSTSKIRAFQNNDVVRVIESEHSVTVKATLMETNNNTLPLFFKDNFASGKGEFKAGMSPHRAWVFHEIDGTSLIRTTIDDGQIIDIGDVTVVNGKERAYPITIECFPNASGVKGTQYFATATVSA